MSQEFFEKLRASEVEKRARWKNMRYNAHVFLPESAKDNRGDSKRTIYFKRPYSELDPHGITTCFSVAQINCNVIFPISRRKLKVFTTLPTLLKYFHGFMEVSTNMFNLSALSWWLTPITAKHTTVTDKRNRQIFVPPGETRWSILQKTLREEKRFPTEKSIFSFYFQGWIPILQHHGQCNTLFIIYKILSPIILQSSMVWIVTICTKLAYLVHQYIFTPVLVQQLTDQFSTEDN